MAETEAGRGFRDPSVRHDQMLLRAADTYDNQVRGAIDKMLAALVPVLTIVMAVLVAGIMLAILLPLLSLTGNIQ